MWMRRLSVSAVSVGASVARFQEAKRLRYEINEYAYVHTYMHIYDGLLID